MTILNISIDENTCIVIDSSDNTVIARLTLGSNDNVKSISFNLSNVEMSLDDLLSMQNSIISAIREMIIPKREMLSIKETNANTLYWSQLGFIFA